MEQGNIMILSGLSSIYPSLYDLFNQNFSVVGGKKYARIALGTSNNPMAYVHGNFKCIIILSEDELEKQDPPFLNRFEKAVITFESLLKKNFYQMGLKIFEKLKSYFALGAKDREAIKLDVLGNLINFSENEVLGLVYILTEMEREDQEGIIEDKILKKIVPLFSQDMIAALNFNLCAKGKLDELEKINAIYRKNLSNNLEEYISKKFEAVKKIRNNIFNLEAAKINKNSDNNRKLLQQAGVNLVYTYNSIFDEIYFNENREIKAEINAITTFRCEFDLEKAFSNFMKKDKNVFILKFRVEDLHLINYSKFLCEQIYKSFNVNFHKLFVFIIYTSRILVNSKNFGNEKDKKSKIMNLSDNTNCVSLISQGDQIFIDNLNADEDLEKFENEDCFKEVNYNGSKYIDFNFAENSEDVNFKDYDKNPFIMNDSDRSKVGLNNLDNKDFSKVSN